MNNEFKTRNLSYLKYFEQLQLEYIITELRKKIYPSIKDKKYYERVMKGKREIIEDLSIRNSLKSIFNDKEKRKKKYKEIYNPIGYPNFFYKDKKDEALFGLKDKKNYYMIDSEFRINIKNIEKLGILKKVSFITNSAELDIIGEGDLYINIIGDLHTNIFDLSYITRIL